MSTVRTQNLKNACRALERSTDRTSTWRPVFHLAPVTGWLNDPNGCARSEKPITSFSSILPLMSSRG